MPLVQQAAKVCARQWPDVLDAEEIQQELWIEILTNPKLRDWIAQCLSNDETSRAVNAFIRKGTTICSRERISYEVFSGQWIYSTSEVDQLLWKISYEQQLMSSEIADVQSALKTLKRASPAHYLTVYEAYISRNPDYTRVDKLKKRKSRALKRLTEIMNTKRSALEKLWADGRYEMEGA